MHYRFKATTQGGGVAAAVVAVEMVHHTHEEEEDKVDQDALHPSVFIREALSIPILPWSRDVTKPAFRRHRLEDVILLGALEARWREKQASKTGHPVLLGSHPSEMDKLAMNELDLYERILHNADAARVRSLV
jgi:hypothetical protein